MAVYRSTSSLRMRPLLGTNSTWRRGATACCCSWGFSHLASKLHTNASFHPPLDSRCFAWSLLFYSSVAVFSRSAVKMNYTTKVVQVTNVSPSTTSEQMRTLFGFLGTIEELKLFPPEWVDLVLLRSQISGISSRVSLVASSAFEAGLWAHANQMLSQMLTVTIPLLATSRATILRLDRCLHTNTYLLYLVSCLHAYSLLYYIYYFTVYSSTL